MGERLVGPSWSEEDQTEGSLRPRLLADYIGQDKVKDQVRILLDAARGRQESLDHVLLYGPPGLGKTSLAIILAAEMQANLRMTSGPAIEHGGDLASLLTALEANDVLFIDEIHRLSRDSRRTPIFRHGRLRAGHHHWQGAGGAKRATQPAPLHRRRRHDSPGLTLSALA